MLTPLFELSQDDKFIIATIRTPFAKLAETEFEFGGTQFMLSSPPYFLRLYLPGEIVENGEESATYDFDKKSFLVKLPKKEHGQHFVGLDMITQLLTPKGKASARLPEVISEDNGDANDNAEGESDDENENEDEDEILIEQTVPTTSSIEDTYSYGFANRRRDVFSTLRDELFELFDIKTPDQLPVAERRTLACSMEEEKFSDDHYLMDYFSTEQIDELLDQPDLLRSIVAGNSQDETNKTYTNEQIDRLKDLPKKSFTLDSSETVGAFCGLANIIFAYLYDLRTTCGEHNVESGWAITKLSSTLSCLLSFDNMSDAMCACIRRSLCYSLFRNWKLSTQVLDDTKLIFSSGKVSILKCLLDIHRIFAEDSDYRYILNDLYITDYCVWLQGVSDDVVKGFSDKLAKVVVTKADVDLSLDELELAGQLTLEESQRKIEQQPELDSDDDDEDDVPDDVERLEKDLNVLAL